MDMQFVAPFKIVQYTDHAPNRHLVAPKHVVVSWKAVDTPEPCHGAAVSLTPTWDCGKDDDDIEEWLRRQRRRHRRGAAAAPTMTSTRGRGNDDDINAGPQQRRHQHGAGAATSTRGCDNDNDGIDTVLWRQRRLRLTYIG